MHLVGPNYISPSPDTAAPVPVWWLRREGLLYSMKHPSQEIMYSLCWRYAMWACSLLQRKMEFIVKDFVRCINGWWWTLSHDPACCRYEDSSFTTAAYLSVKTVWLNLGCFIYWQFDTPLDLTGMDLSRSVWEVSLGFFNLPKEHRFPAILTRTRSNSKYDKCQSKNYKNESIRQLNP